jgi:hypothetical protein
MQFGKKPNVLEEHIISIFRVKATQKTIKVKKKEDKIVALLN